MFKQAPVHEYKILTDRTKTEVVEGFKLDHPGCTVLKTVNRNGVLVIKYTKQHEVETAERENEEYRQRLKGQAMHATRISG
ncbi:hypothetical protein BBD42_26990 [Paenibacillus sp. BIHB 4019]|uniref:Uncharacterized protein n=1 Tax=Paenibacillus sp. BIHB 4019 TaxID=1870819 RepID=A0A1B2DPV3_9BACL|nr:hypothetical protein [Paenibacillus sp. BIHB 4019]ANY69730.1 hypothetical protein BBD42_26990 [Paenibacillus sp. BIHB 4019]